MTNINLTLIIIAVCLMGIIQADRLKLEKCEAFNNNEEAVINCYFDN